MFGKIQLVGKGAAAKLNGGDYPRLKRWWSGARVVVLPLGIVALCYWASQERSMRWSDGWNAYLLFGALASQLSVAFLALRFRHVLHLFDLRLSVVESLRINTLAMFYHFFVPLSVGAEITKFVKLRSVAPDRRPLVTAGAIMLDHAVGFVALAVILIVLWVAIRPFELEFVPSAVLMVAALGLGAAVCAAWRTRMASTLAATEILRRLREHNGDVLVAFGYSLFMNLTLAAAVFAASSGWGIEIGYWEILFVLTASFIFYAVPVSLAGIGVADVAGTGLYLALGLPLADAVLLASLMVCYRILAAVIGGLWDLAPASSTGD